MSPSPDSSVVRRTIDLNYANKQRSLSLKWIFIHGILFVLFTFDLLYKCPGYTSAMHYCEAAAAAACGAAVLAHARRLLPAAGAVALSPRQQRLLGLGDRDVVRADPPELAPRADPPAPLAPARSWRAPVAPRAPPSPPSPPGRAVRDRFIADRAALDRYLSDAADAAADDEGGGGPALAPLAPASPYRLAPLVSEPGAGEEAGGAPGAALWRRLNVEPQHLAQFNLNLRRWLHATILERLARELDACAAALAAAGHEARPGEAAPARLEALGAGAPPALARRVRALLPFLRPFADQRYAAARVRELARGGCLRAFRWDGGGADWSPARPADAELVLELFAAYMEGVVPGGGFRAAHVSAAPAPPPRALALHRASQRPPHYVVALGAEAVELCRGRDNLLHSLLLFLAAAARREPPALCRLHLGPAGLNMLWILGR